MYTIMVVDDEPDYLKLLSEAFEKTNEFQVTRAINGAQAYVKSRKQPFDLICTDYEMPQASGLELLQSVRANRINAKTPFIFITGHPEEAQELTAGMKTLAIVEKTTPIANIIRVAQDLINVAKTKTKSKIDVNLINYFIDAAIHSIGVQANLEDISQDRPFMLTPDTNLDIDISGVIKMVGTAFSGTLVISFPKVTFLQLVSRILGETIAEITEEVEDAAAEFTNIVYGQIRRVLGEEGHIFQSALPTTVKGPRHKVPELLPNSTFIVPFVSYIGMFYIQVCIGEPST